MINVALDVHVRNSFIKARNGSGDVLAQGRAGNTLLELSQKLAGVERAARDTHQPVRAVLEATGNSRAMALLLERWGKEAEIDLTVDVLDARKLQIIAQSVSKCDRLDAQVLLDLSASNLRLPICYLADSDEFALREHLRSRQDLVRVRTMVKNRIHAVLHRRGILRPAKLDLFAKAGRLFLAQAEIDQVGRKLLGDYLAVVDQMDQLLDDSERLLRQLSRSERWRRNAAILESMPGVGLITSLTILAELGDIDRFRGRDAVANYAGLVPVVRDSNAKTYRGGLVSHGNRPLRSVLIEAAWVAIARAPVYAALYQRVESRRGAATAIVAVARRLLEDAWTMLKKQEPFRYARPLEAGVAASAQAVMRLA